MSCLEGKNVFVTGGSRGIGRAISLMMAREGANICFTYRNNQSEADLTLKKIEEIGVKSLKFKCDVRDRQELKKIFKYLKEQWGSLDVLVNNAGVNNPTDFDHITDDDWDEVLSTNLKGPFIVTQEAFPLLSEAEAASIINIGSVSGQYGGPRTAHYAASKAGLISLGQVIARFGASKNIRCNTIAAGLIDSEMAGDGMKSPAVQKASEAIVLKRMGSFDEVASAVLFLASDHSSYITAQTINVNGGLYF